MSEVKELTTLKPRTEELADKFKKVIHIDPKTGVGTVPKEFYQTIVGEAVPEDIKAKYPGIEADLIPIAKGLQDFNALVAGGAGYAFGQASEKFLHKHKDFDSVELEIPTIGKDGFELRYDRSRQVPARNADGTTGTQTAYGLLRVGYRTYGAESVGELKKVKKLLSASAAKVLGE